MSDTATSMGLTEHAAASSRAELRAAVERAEAAEARNQKIMCPFCGSIETRDNDNWQRQMAMHVAECEKHPMRAAVATLCLAEAELSITRERAENAEAALGEIAKASLLASTLPYLQKRVFEVVGKHATAGTDYVPRAELERVHAQAAAMRQLIEKFHYGHDPDKCAGPGKCRIAAAMSGDAGQPILDELNAYRHSFPTCEAHKPGTGARSGCLVCALIERDGLIEQLDEAMASPALIAMDTQHVGGFVSSLNLTETAEQIVGRAIAELERLRKEVNDWKQRAGKLVRFVADDLRNAASALVEVQKPLNEAMLPLLEENTRLRDWQRRAVNYIRNRKPYLPLSDADAVHKLLEELPK